MRSRRLAVVAALAALVGLGGCALLDNLAERCGWATNPPTYNQYHLSGWPWDSVARVVVLPFENQSNITRAGDEVRDAFTSEFQRLGRFEVVALRGDEWANMSKHVHHHGEFDEAVVLNIAQETRADVIIYGVVTQYSPYHPRPRLGLILQTVSPTRAKVVASVDGLWDTTDKKISNRLRRFYWERNKDRLPFVRNNVPQKDDAFAAEMVIESPALFQRFVCHEATLTLVGLPVPGVTCPEEPDPSYSPLWFYPLVPGPPAEPPSNGAAPNGNGATGPGSPAGQPR